jgi:hypothetical protein
MYKLNNIIKEKKVVKKTYRFKFSNDLINIMKNFSQIHKDENKEDFDNSLNKWFINNNELIQRDFNLIKENGYEGDLKIKLYNSIRYYYCKKNYKENRETEKTLENKETRKYIKLNKELLNIIDKHIIENIQKEEFKPSIGLKEFINKYEEEINKEYEKILETETKIKEEDFNKKIKKTYNNRYYNISKKIEKGEPLF